MRDEDQAIVKAALAGNPKAFTEIVHRYQERLYNFGLRMCKNRQDAEDLIQDTFINAFRSLSGFKGKAKFKNWIYTIAANACLKKKRAIRNAPENEVNLEEWHQQTMEQGHHSTVKMPAWADAPLDSLLNEELSAKIRKSIEKLPTKYRLVLLLRDVEGFSTDETAEMLHLSTANVKVRLHRARFYLRDHLKGYFEDDR
ncbi:sigma-70 family RNA polymerase sigma factor [Desulfobacterales bacterium HSG17]|nr:sigma-70 family RNA polymerase sigma factor [Desulfobacterales bacterium HSG17]